MQRPTHRTSEKCPSSSLYCCSSFFFSSTTVAPLVGVFLPDMARDCAEECVGLDATGGREGRGGSKRRQSKVVMSCVFGAKMDLDLTLVCPTSRHGYYHGGSFT